MIAALPMYARASNRAAHDALWALIRDGLRARGIAATDALDHDTDHMAGWAHDDLVLSQICNLPYRARFRDRVTLIGAADYGLEGCAPGYYRSHFVVHRDNPARDPAMLADARFVCNEPLSQSGYGAAQLWAAARGFRFALHAQTGSHKASITAVAEGKGDIAAIDAQTWAIEVADNPDTRALRIIGHTDASPGLTFVTRKGQDRAPYFAAIDAAITALDSTHRTRLGLRAIVALPASAYDLPIPPDPAP